MAKINIEDIKKLSQYNEEQKTQERVNNIKALAAYNEEKAQAEKAATKAATVASANQNPFNMPRLSSGTNIANEIESRKSNVENTQLASAQKKIAEVENAAKSSTFSGANSFPTLGTSAGIAGNANAMESRNAEKRYNLVTGLASQREQAQEEYNKSISQNWGKTGTDRWQNAQKVQSAKAELEKADAKLSELGVTTKDAAKQLKQVRKENKETGWLGNVTLSALKGSAASTTANIAGAMTVGEKLFNTSEADDAYWQQRYDDANNKVKELEKELATVEEMGTEWWQIKSEIDHYKDSAQVARVILEKRNLNGADKLYTAALGAQNDSSTNLQKAYEQKPGKIGEFVTDITSSTMGMGLDLAVGAATGAAPLLISSLRTGGSTAIKAKSEGQSNEKATLRGSLDFIKTYMIGKITSTSGIAKKFTGNNSSIDDIVEGAINKLSKSASNNVMIQSALNYLFSLAASAAGEGLEEMAEDLFDPALDALVSPGEGKLKQYGDSEYWSDMLYDGLIGGIMGFAGAMLDVGKLIPDTKAKTETKTESYEDMRREYLEVSNRAKTSPESITEADFNRAVELENIIKGIGGREAVEPTTDTAQTLGENGKRSFSEILQGTNGKKARESEFIRYYEAGLNGAEVKGVDTQKSVLNDTEKRSAYTAGQMDAQESFNTETATSEFADVAGSDSGLVYDEFVREAIYSGRERTDINGETGTYLTMETAMQINETAKALGVRVQFADSVRYGTANAEISGSTITIEKNNPNPVMFIVGHEMTHRVQELAPNEYRAFREIALTEDWDLVQKRIAAYASQGIEISREAAMDEITADYAGRLIDDSEVLTKFIESHRSDRTLLEKIRDAIKSLISKLTGKEKTKATEAEKALTAALDAAAKQTERVTNSKYTKMKAELDALNEKARTNPQSLTEEEFNRARDIGSRLEEMKKAVQADGDSKYSIKYDENNKPYVDVEEDILAGVPQSEWVKTVKDNLREKFPDGIEVGNNVIEINKQSQREMTYSKYTRYLNNTEPELYADKLKATNNADEILLASRNYINEGLNHPRKDKIEDFARGEVLMQIGENGYSAEVVVAKQANGTLLLYDILQMKPENIYNKAEKKSAAAITEDLSPRTGRSTATSFGENVTQSGENVNKRFSLEAELDALNEKARTNPQSLTEEEFNRARDIGAKLEEMKKAAQADGRYSIKQTSQMTLDEQLKNFYNGKMASSDAFYFGETPEALSEIGLDTLPLAFTQSDFKKSTKEKHNVPRRVLKNINSDLENALFAFSDGERIGIMTDDIDGDGKPLLVGIERNVAMERKPVNAIRSIYGLDNPDLWLKNQFESGKEYIPLNKERADAFLQTYGYSALVGDNIYSSRDNVAHSGENVNNEFSLKAGTETKSDAEARLKARTEKEAQKQKGEAVTDGTEQNAENAERSAEGAEESTIPKKAQNYIDKAQNALTQKMGEWLSVPRGELREEIKPHIAELTDEYLKTGDISRESADRVFNEAYEKGIKIDSEFYDEYKDVKDYLRSTAISISETDRSSIADWKDFRKNAFGTLKISKDGAGVDTAYAELSERAPALFPAEITHPTDQIQKMYEVGKSIRKAKRTLDEYYGNNAEEFRKWAKHDFDVEIDSLKSELWRAKRYSDEKAQSANETETEYTAEKVKENYASLKQARKDLDKVKSKNLLTQEDEIVVGRILRGETDIDSIDAKKYNVKGISAVYKAQAEYEKYAAEIRKYNAQRRAKLSDTAENLLAANTEWKDKKAGLSYSINTMERNIYDIAGRGHEAEAKALIDEYFTPVHANEAEATRTKNEYRERVESLNLSRKVEKGNKISESAAVQLLGEAEDNIRVLRKGNREALRDGKSLADWEGEVENLWIENPKLDEVKIRNAVEEFHDIYNELFEKMNDVRAANGYEPVNYRNGYFPHFQSSEDSILARFGHALGIDMDVDTLPTSINGLTHTFKPGITWFSAALERQGVNTTYDAVQGFDKYIEGVTSVIYHTEDLQKLRSLATQIRYRSGDKGLKAQIDEIQARTDITDAERNELIRTKFENGKYELSNFVAELDEYTNGLANKKSLHDRSVEGDVGRRIYTITSNFYSRVAANMVAINPASWLTNFIPLTQGWINLDTKHLLKGMQATLKAYTKGDDFVSRSDFLTNRRGSDPIVKSWTQEASAALSKPMDYIDSFTADTLVRARYMQNIEKGLSENAAMSEADSWTAGVMADRSKGALPTVFNRKNPLAKTLTQFQVEQINQLEFFGKDVPREFREKLNTAEGKKAKIKATTAIVSGIAKAAIGAYIYNELYEYIIGRRPALDPLGMIKDTAEDIMDDDLDGWDVVSNLGTEIAENIPFVGGLIGGGRVPISSALPDFENLGKALLNDDWSTEKKISAGAKAITPVLTYSVLPFGGGQLKKIVQGLTAVGKGGSYTKDSDGNDILQYPVYNDTVGQAVGNGIKSAVFGKSSLQTGQEWVENGYDSLSAKQTEVYKKLTEAGISQKDAREIINTYRKAEKTEDETQNEIRRGILRDSSLSGEGKAIIYYGLMASEKEKEVMDLLADEGIGDVAETLMNLKDAEASDGESLSQVKYGILLESNLDEDAKREIYTQMISSSHEDDIERITDSGLSFDRYLEIQSKYTEINEKDISASKKALELERYIEQEGFNAEQEKAIEESFKFYSMVVGQNTKYDELTELGLDDETAATVIEASEDYDLTTSAEKLEFYREVINSVKGDNERLLALTPYLTERDVDCCTYAFTNGIGPAEWVTMKELTLDCTTQADVKEAIDRIPGLTQEQRAILWQMKNKSWKAKNNPYDTQAGQKAYDFLNG